MCVHAPQHAVLRFNSMVQEKASHLHEMQLRPHLLDKFTLVAVALTCSVVQCACGCHRPRELTVRYICCATQCVRATQRDAARRDATRTLPFRYVNPSSSWDEMTRSPSGELVPSKTLCVCQLSHQFASSVAQLPMLPFCKLPCVHLLICSMVLWPSE
jgi:hypothetical protein